MSLPKCTVLVFGGLVALTPLAEANQTSITSKVSSARQNLNVFADSRGCKLLSSNAVVKRLNEIASIGSITWQGACKQGFISGTGILREEGVMVVGGKTKKFAYFLSGRANKGVRTGRWKRETYDKFTNSTKFWTSIATVNFVNGLATAPPKPIRVTSWNQYTENFRTRFIDPELQKDRVAEPAQDGLQSAPMADTSAPKPEPAVASPTQTSSPVARPSPMVAATAAADAAPGKAPVVNATDAGSVQGASVGGPSNTVAATPARAPAPTPAMAPSPTEPLPATTVETASVPPIAASSANTIVDVAIKLAAKLPAPMAKQTFVTGGSCYMDTLDGRLWEDKVLTVKDRKSIRITGWGVDSEGKRLSAATYVRLENSKKRRYYAATTPEDRPDVVTYLGQPAFLRSGYRALFSAEKLPAGEYKVAIVMNAGGRNVLCGNGRKLRL